MQLIDPYADLKTYRKIVQKYGGEYTLFEKLRMGGVGSPKVTYISGIPEFDAIHYTDDLEQSMTNFELLKGGLIIRINKRQNLAVAIAHLRDLNSIRIEAKKVLIDGRKKEEGRLTITFKKEEPLFFKMPHTVFEGVKKFFNKRVFGAFLQ